MRLCVALLVLLCTVCVGAQLLNLVTIKGNQLPYLQTFDSWDNCYNYGTCYERRCDKLRSGFYNAKYQSEVPSGTEIRHWWVIDTQTPTNWEISTGLPGACSSVQTGPCYDHTQGASGGGKYMYVDASGCFGVEFELITPTIQFTNSSPTIEFWYFMYGDNIGSGYIALDYSDDNTTTWNQIFSESGQEQTGGGQPWLKASVVVPVTTPTDADPVEVVFRFRARTGNNFRSDLAIDDILITQDGTYPNVTTPWIDPNCTATDTCIPPSTSSTGVPFVSGSSGGGGLSDGDIAGIVIGIVGGAIALCCCLIIIIIIVLLIISPKKPPEGGSDGL